MASVTTGGGANRLLSSNEKVAIASLVTAVVTLGFTVWLSIELRQVRDVRVPLAESANRLETSLSSSAAALGEWVAHQDPDARARRRRLWQTRIAPEVGKLRRIAEDDGQAQLVAEVERLGRDLQSLQRLEWLVEDIAHAPGDRPALSFYEVFTRRLSHHVLETTQLVLHNPPERADPALLLAAATFHDAVADADAALRAQVGGDNDAASWRVSIALEAAQRARTRLEPLIAAARAGPAIRSLEYAISEFDPFVEHAEIALEMSQSPQPSLHRRIHEQELKPLLQRAHASATKIALDQSSVMRTAVGAMTRWAAAVVLLALFTGIVSGGALVVSFRISNRMHQVLEKAKTLGQYSIEARIGGGGMGEVYRAKHAMLRRPTAVKLLHAHANIDLLAQERFRREVQLTSQLTHPNTIQIYDYGKTPDGIFYYAMELLEGVNLQTLVERTGPMPPARVVHVLRQVCGSLAEAHAKGLLHRDVKPSNLMLTERGGVRDTVKVLDFGLVTELGQTSTAQSGQLVVGTPLYLAPETIREPTAASPATDLYAVGATAFFLLTGEPLFSLESAKEILQAQIETLPDAPSSRLGRVLPEGLDAIVLSCLDKDPAGRPEDAAHLQALLREIPTEAWTEEDAERWWHDYGDSLRASEGGPHSKLGSGVASGFAVDRSLDRSRSRV